MIKETKGVPVLAHPMSLYVSWGKLGPVLHDLHERGIEGLRLGIRVLAWVNVKGPMNWGETRLFHNGRKRFSRSRGEKGQETRT